MEYTELPAPPPLDELVHCFWFLRGTFPSGGEPQTVVADGRLEIILHLAEPFSRVDGDNIQRQADALVSGQLTAPIRLAGNGAGDVVGIRFRTSAAARVLRVPLTDLTDRVEPLAAVSRRLAADLIGAARSREQPGARVSTIARALVKHVERPPDALASTAIAALEGPDARRIESLARSLRTTTRTLERRVTVATGLPPATLRRIMRFRHAFRLLDGAPRGTWARVATRAGYADQAHLIRDFHQFAGVAPGDFFQEEPSLARAIMGAESNQG
jgi:AraC-like DNA-binding protein